LGGYGGRLVGDRWSAYKAWPLARRQLCWAHLRREFTAFTERGGTAHRVGQALLAETTAMSAAWHRVRASEGRTVVVEAEAGNGASRLLDEFCRSVSTREPTAIVLRARGFASERAEEHTVTRAVLSQLVTAPGLGQPRPKRRGEARGLHLYEVDERSIRVLTYAWAGNQWAQIADRRFPRGLEPLSVVG